MVKVLKRRGWKFLVRLQDTGKKWLHFILMRFGPILAAWCCLRFIYSSTGEVLNQSTLPLLYMKCFSCCFFSYLLFLSWSSNGSISTGIKKGQRILFDTVVHTNYTAHMTSDQRVLKALTSTTYYIFTYWSRPVASTQSCFSNTFVQPFFFLLLSRFKTDRSN